VFLPGVAVESLVVGEGSATMSLSNGEAFESPLAVSAEGRDSPLREAQGIRSVAWDYPQIGIVVTVEHERPHNGVAYEHFLPAGPFAILPMTGNRASLVWTEETNEARWLLGLDDRSFTAELRLRFGGHLGEVSPTGPRWSYPLRLHLARSYVQHRFALIGDAAHTIHPIAGQGLNLGLKDAAALAETVLDAARLGLDFGRSDVLERYERWRRFDSMALAAATDGLNRLMSNSIPPLRCDPALAPILHAARGRRCRHAAASSQGRGGLTLSRLSVSAGRSPCGSRHPRRDRYILSSSM
jgi:2-octaprenyl-6-methoxyphenol hydroxylase